METPSLLPTFVISSRFLLILLKPMPFYCQEGFPVTNVDVELLPTQLTKKKVWDCYINSCATHTYKLASYRSFCRVWQRYKPYIIITRPTSDLFFTCQSNSMAITMSANKSENDKLKVKISYQ